ncbi:hypothetical protein H072_130 [Dactylellina haptotyla CBS 200.50]|uniref:Uncharacterized protein n=1 Tax=Dactylellina haptotyla (strain CBS 200.50) TaxID=1284197 RepID=S8AY26_DACHA|nr:hypothetical protein H072_130 [Dactylellina haptotyla CBS 200.50]
MLQRPAKGSGNYGERPVRGPPETVDANDWQRYMNKPQENELSSNPNNAKQEHYSAGSRQGSRQEVSTGLETRFSAVEIQVKDTTRAENSSIGGQRPSEHVQRYGSGYTSTARGFSNANEAKPIPKSQEMENSFWTGTTKYKKAPKNPQNAPQEPASEAPRNYSQPATLQPNPDVSYLDDYDLSDDESDDELKIAFHKAEIKKLMEAGVLNPKPLGIHVKALVETYKVFSDFKVVLIMAVHYLGGDEAQIQQCRDLLADFKADSSKSPEDNIAGYLTRALAAYWLKDFSAAYKDSKRIMTLARKNPAIREADRFANYAASIASWCAAEMKNEADELYYKSLCIDNLPLPAVWAGSNVLFDFSHIVRRSRIDTKPVTNTTPSEIRSQPPLKQVKQDLRVPAHPPDMETKLDLPESDYDIFFMPSEQTLFIKKPWVNKGLFSHTTALNSAGKGVIKVHFENINDILAWMNCCILNNQPSYPAQFLQLGYHHKGKRTNQPTEIGYEWPVQYPWWIREPFNRKGNGCLDVFALLGGYTEDPHFSGSDFPQKQLDSQLTIEDKLDCYHSLLVRIEPKKIRSGTHKEKEKALITALGVGNWLPAYLLAEQTPTLLTSNGKFQGSVRGCMRVMSPLTLAFILESRQEIPGEHTFFNLVPKEHLDLKQDRCKIAELSLFHVAIKFTTKSAKPLKALFKAHGGCLACLDKRVHGELEIPASPYEFLLREAMVAISSKSSRIDILKKMTKVFQDNYAAFAGFNIFDDTQQNLLSKNGFPLQTSFR